MSRLRRASHSSMEDLRIDNENVENVAANGQNAKTEVKEDKVMLPSKVDIVEPRPAADENRNVKGNSTSCQEKEDSYITVRKSADEQLNKVEASSPVDVNGLKHANEATYDMINSTGQVKENGHSEPSDGEESHNDAPKPSFDKLRSVFGPQAVKQPTLDVNDSFEPKSSPKYPNKQNACAVNGDQLGGGLGDQLVSTENSKGIMEDQQENKNVIKTEESIQEAPSKVEKKPRKSLLNVVDPLEVLQLTKDPILSKGKPISSDLGLIKAAQSGRKPTVEIIKSQPDNKNKIAQINRAWDLNHVQPAHEPRSQVNAPTMPSNSSPQTPSDVPRQNRNIPVTSIDEIPVSSIDEVAVNGAKSSEGNVPPLLVGNATFYTGSQSTESSNHENEAEGEFIPVSSIDDDDDPSSLIPPEIVFEKNPEKVRSCFITGGTKVKKPIIITLLLTVLAG